MRGERINVIATMIVAITFGACSDDDHAATPHPRGTRTAPATPPEPSYRAVEVTDTGTISGNVRWQGDLPDPQELEVLVHREACGPTQPTRALRVSEQGGVTDVVVSIDARRGAELVVPETALVIDNVGCRFEPHVTLAGVGWPLIFRNSDEVLHNVHALRDDDTVLDLGLPERGAEVQRSVTVPGPLRLLCDAGHVWQRAWVHVFEHPYFAVTDERGHFQIGAVPPGQYTLRVWHEGWRMVGRRAGRPRWSNPVVLSRSVSVTTEQETTVDFELSTQSAEIAGD